MKKFIRRATAGLLLAALMLTSAPGSMAYAEKTTHIHTTAVDTQDSLFVSEEELASGKVFLATAEMLDDKGVLTLEGGEWDRMVITRDVNAAKVALNGVTVRELAVESGLACTFEVSDSAVTNVEVVAPRLEVIGYEELCEMLASGMDATEVAAAYKAYLAEKKAVEAIVPEIVIKGGAEIATIKMTGNAKLDLTDAKVAEVKVSSNGSQERMLVTIEGYQGTVSVAQENSGYGILNLSLKNSELEALTVTGSEKGACYIEGAKDSVIKQMNITGAAQVTMNVAATEVKLDEKAEKASVKIYSDVKNVIIKGNNVQLRVASNAKVENALVEGDNVKVSTSGTIGNSTITGTGSDISVVPDVPASPSYKDEPAATPKPTATPTPEVPEEPTPEDPENPSDPSPIPSVSPSPEEPEVHTHTWNVEKATCVTAKKCTECGHEEEAATGIHTWGEEGVVKAPTCTEGGYTTYKCVYCDETEKKDIVAQTGHTVETWTIGTAVEGKSCTYTQTGVCTVCEETVVSDTTVEKHSTELVFAVTKQATCQEDGIKSYSCPVCKTVIKEESYENKDAHSWDDGKNVGGTMVYTCTVEGCKATKTEVSMTTEGVSGSALTENTQVKIDSNAGDGKGVVMSFDGSVLQQINGTTTETATGAALKLSADVLDETAKKEAVAKLDEATKEQLEGINEIFDFNMLVNDKTVSKFEGMVTVRIPYVLGEGEDPNEVAVWYLGDNGVVEGVKGKYHNGYVSFETNHFSYYTVVRLTPEARCKLFGHLWLSAETNPTCTEDGFITKICQRCEATETSTGDKATGHVMVEETLNQADCQNKGKVKHYCKNCDFVQELDTAKGEHDLKECGRVEATCEKAGYVEYECQKEGCEYHKKETIKALGHTKGEDNKCTVCGADVTCKHPRTITLVELAEGSKTCEDGVITKRVCLLCEETVNEGTTKNHISGVLDYINLYAYGENCSGYIALRGCACGETDSWFTRNTGDSSAWDTMSYYEFDEQGIQYRVTEYTCAADNVTVIRKYYDVPVEGETCKLTRHTTWTVKVGEEVKDTISAPINQYTHDTVYDAALAEGSKTCEDGVTYTAHCLTCKQEVGKGTATHHMYDSEIIDLSQYEGFCGGYILVQSCPCGYDGNINYWGYVECNFNTSGQMDTDENGVEHYKMTYTCLDCNAIITDNYSITELENCRGTRTGVLTVYEKNQAVKSYEYTYGIDTHDTYDILELLEGSKTCEDGVKVTQYCHKCEQELGSWTSTYHTTAEKEIIDFSKYDGTCGGRFIQYGCACGECNHMDVYSEDGCQMIYSWDNVTGEDGMEYEVETARCQDCPVWFTMKKAEAEGEDCNVVVAYEYNFYVGEELIKNITFNNLETRHDSYYTSATLLGAATSCEDGVRCTEVCRDCGYTWTGVHYWHVNVLQEEINLADCGVACGGTIRTYKCACDYANYDADVELGCDTGDTWSDMLWGNYELVEEKEDGEKIYQATYACAVTDPKCTFHIMMEKHERYTVEECKRERQVYFCGDANGDGEYEIKVLVEDYTYTSHGNIKWSDPVYETAEDGTKLRVETATCENCGKYKYENVYADYLKDESYRYHIRHSWGEEGDMEHEEWVYNFTDSNCTYTRIRSNDNGYYQVQETMPGCMANNENIMSGLTCTQYAYGVCEKCKKENPLNVRYFGEPRNHWFRPDESGEGYTCYYCDLENENGQSGRIVLEDLSDEANYISGYWNRDELVFEIFVVLKTAEEDILTDLKVANTPVYETGIASIAKADVEKCAADEGVTGSYEVTFSFIPKNASVDTTYNITFE